MREWDRILGEPKQFARRDLRVYEEDREWVVRAGSRVGVLHAPAYSPLERGSLTSSTTINYIKDLHCPVRRASRQSLSVVVKLGIVLKESRAPRNVRRM